MCNLKKYNLIQILIQQHPLTLHLAQRILMGGTGFIKGDRIK
jgi:hypothetical protein